MEKKNWRVQYDHKDGRKGTVDATTEVIKRMTLEYGNDKSGLLTVDGFIKVYNLRYNHEKDLHMVMLEDYFGRGLVEAVEV